MGDILCLAVKIRLISQIGKKKRFKRCWVVVFLKCCWVEREEDEKRRELKGGLYLGLRDLAAIAL